MDLKKTTAKKKRALTLIEMIVVLMILTMITGALAYNYKKSIDHGKEFERKEMVSRIQAVMDMAIALGEVKESTDASKWEDLCKKSPLIQNGDKFVSDAKAAHIDVKVSASTNSKEAAEATVQ